MGNMDDVLRMMEEDDLADKAELAKMTPREYAKLRGVEPQIIYYYIRTKKIRDEVCICGRRVVDVPSANEFFAAKEKAERTRQGLGSTDSE